MKKIIVIGGKGTAVNVAEALVDARETYNEKIEFLGFAIDDETLGDEINGFPVLCKTREVNEKFSKYEDVQFLFQLHRMDKMVERKKLVNSYGIDSKKWFTFVHPLSFVSKSVRLGYGTVVYANCAIHSNAIIGNHCMFSANTTIGHDTIIKDNVFTGTHVCIGSYVNIEECNFFGQNVAVKGEVSIAKNNLFGISATVSKNVEVSNKILIGTPAKSFKSL